MKAQLLVQITVSVLAVFMLQTVHAQNTAYGSGALISNTTGAYNTAFGYRTLYSNTTGGYNTGVGYALYSNITGHNNVAVGHASLFYNSTGYHNTGVGSGTLTYNTSGYKNSAMGMYSLHFNTTGYDNTASGAFALYNNQSGCGNTASGDSSLNQNTTGSSNAATGMKALFWNTIGNYNSAHGTYASYSNTKGSNNVAMGYNALYTDTSGGKNTAVGAGALYAITKGNENTALGYNAGTVYNCYACTFLGANTTPSASGLVNSTAIGSKAKITANNQVRIGSTAVTSIGGPVGWSTVSDGRYKNQVQEDVPGLAFIKKLRPVSYHLDVEKIDWALDNKEHHLQNVVAETASPEEQKARQQQAQMKYTGFIAQEVEKAAKDLNYDFSGVDKPKNEQDLYGLRYEVFVVPLVKAVQELNKENEALKERVSKLEALLTNQTSTVNAAVNNVVLEQNVPNPFSSTTSIRYSIPGRFQKAQLVVTDKFGKSLKQVSLHSSSGVVNLDGTFLSGGTYQYSLLVDGSTLVSKTMVIAK